MHTILLLSANSRNTAGVLLLTIVAIEYGGWFMLRVVRGRQPATPFQQAFLRAGHAHAGVLVTLALVGQILADATSLFGPLADLARDGIWAAAILMPAGFFLSAAGKGITKPNRFIAAPHLNSKGYAYWFFAFQPEVDTILQRMKIRAK